MPLLLEVDAGREKVLAWTERNQPHIQRLLHQNGAVLLRGLIVNSSKQFSRLLCTLFGAPLLEYKYRSTPRTGLKGNIYTATEYACDATIPQHNENSYADTWPDLIGFVCMVAPTEGGQTPISDSRRIYEQLSPEIIAEFSARGVMYVRNYVDLDLPWSEVFQTHSRDEVAQYCKQHNIAYQWSAADLLQTRQVNAAVQVHPQTGELVWFNQAHLFHVSSLPLEVRSTLLRLYGEEGGPRNAYFGDGRSIPEEYLVEIRSVYERNMIRFHWRKNDILLLDNMMFAHGREPYSGERKVLVGMGKRPQGTNGISAESP